MVPPTGPATVPNAETLEFETYQASNESSLNEHAGELTKKYGPIDVLAESSWTAADFEDTTEGDGPAKTDVTFGCMFQLQDANGDDITPGGTQSVTRQGSVQIRVKNETATADTGGEGKVSVGGEDQDPQGN